MEKQRYFREATGKGYYRYRDRQTGHFAKKELWVAEKESQWMKTAYELIMELEYPEK